ncbi:MAG: hypothetical protein ABFD00_03475 [Chloroherpetonaceae bacterium]
MNKLNFIDAFNDSIVCCAFSLNSILEESSSLTDSQLNKFSNPLVKSTSLKLFLSVITQTG